MPLKQEIRDMIEDFINSYQEEKLDGPIWRSPLVGFAGAGHPYIMALKTLIGPEHGLPSDVLDDASIVIACFVPFTKALAETNGKAGRLASAEWAKAYEDTNKMLGCLNQFVIERLCAIGYRAAVSPEAATFDKVRLKSNWSHRHFAYAAGLGRFGINNMLLTKAGGCGRYTTIVTNLPVQPDEPLKEELCLYKRDGSCGVCMRRCPAGALDGAGYDRALCYEVLKENARIYTEFGSSYVDASKAANSAGSEVCGKCTTGVPCAFWNKGG